MGKFFGELRRRNVFRVAGVYAVIGWLLVQVAVALEAALELPGWFDAMVTSLVLLGFPLALILAWAFEMTPDGMKPTSAVAEGDSIARKTGRGLDYALLAGLALVAAVIVGDRLLPGSDTASSSAAATSKGVELDDKSIAVLPFSDLSPEGDQEYFADGLSEELLNVLAQNDALQVAGRTSSFAFKGENRDLREIGEILDVAHVLEGSVRKSGNQIRVTAQLINAKTGYHVFSDTYDGSLDDIFRVQDDIAGQINATLETEWLGEQAIEERAPNDVAAFDLYLKARNLIYSRDAEKMREAERLLDEALEIDPDYAPALAQKSIVTSLLTDSPGSYGDRPLQETVPIALDLAQRAITLDPMLGEAHAAYGLALSVRQDYEAALPVLRKAVALNPGFSDAQNWLATALRDQAQVSEYVEVYERIIEHDPYYAPAFMNLVSAYAETRQFDKAEALIERVERIRGATESTLNARSALAGLRGEPAAAIQFAEKALALSPSNSMVLESIASQSMAIGDYDRAVEGLWIYRPAVLALAGKEEAALAELAEFPPLETGGGFTLAFTTFTYLALGDGPAIIAYLEDNFDTLQDAADLSSLNAVYWLPYAVAAYDQAGDAERRDEALSILEGEIAAYEQAGELELEQAMSRAVLKLYRGEEAAALDELQRIMDDGWVSAFWLDTMMFDPLRDNARFTDLQEAMRERVNAEREKLDMAPLPSE